MANYTGIQGQNILIVDTDPANPTEGQIWYNSTSAVLKGYANVVTNAWASGGNMTTPKQDGAGFGIQTAAIGAGGYVGGYTNNSQSYNGTTWTNTPTINTTRTTRGSGTQTAGLIFGGNAPPADAKQSATELWNGSTWTSNPTGLNTARGNVFSYGTQTASLAAGGAGTPAGLAAATESWNGTSWTTVPGTLNTARGNGGSAGTQTAGLAFGGDPSGAPPETSSATESWNGTSWTSSPNSLPVAKNGNKGAGLQTSALSFGGFNDGASINYDTTESWDGTTWTSTSTMATGRGNLGSAGVGSPTGSSAIAFGGGFPITDVTEEWSGTNLGTRTITTS
jgi:hypothetical protein